MPSSPALAVDALPPYCNPQTRQFRFFLTFVAAYGNFRSYAIASPFAGPANMV